MFGAATDPTISSGPGSISKHAENYCALLKNLLVAHNIQSVADLGCGDFNTGKRISTFVPSYVGVDIAQVVVEQNQRAHGGDRVRFVQGDITRDFLPPADAAIVRQVLQHLTNAEVQSALDNVLRTYSLAFVTEHIYIGSGAKPNLDISHGPGTRLQIKSGILIGQPPFSRNAVAVGDIESSPDVVLRTWLVKGADKQP